MGQTIKYPYSDLISGYVKTTDFDKGVFVMETSDGSEFTVKLTETTFAEMVRNLGEAFMDCTGTMKDMLLTGRFLYAYGVFYPEEGAPFEAKHLVFLGRSERDYRFEQQDWWIKQI